MTYYRDDDDPDPTDLLERDRQREHDRWARSRYNPEYEPSWLDEMEDDDEDA